jgi:hypothetical protein
MGPAERWDWAGGETSLDVAICVLVVATGPLGTCAVVGWTEFDAISQGSTRTCMRSVNLRLRGTHVGEEGECKYREQAEYVQEAVKVTVVRCKEDGCLCLTLASNYDLRRHNKL